MEYFKMIITLFIIMIQCAYQVFAGMNIIQERFVNMTNIITRIPFTTITSCFMKCSAHHECAAIGFVVDPALEMNSECLLLKKVEDYGIDGTGDLLPIFAVIKNEEEFVTKKPILPDCPVNGGYGDWSDYTMCTTSCGKGLRNRTRDCNNPFPRGTGDNCTKLGSPVEESTCNMRPCPINGVWGTWGAYSACSVTCSTGTKTRTRACDSPVASHGGLICFDSVSKTRKTSVSDDASCDTGVPCPVNGGFGSWGSWGSCSKTCGRGVRTKVRPCDSPIPQHGGDDCTGEKQQFKSCVLAICAPDFCKSISSGRYTSYLLNGNGGIYRSETVTCKYENGYNYTEFNHDALSTRQFNKALGNWKYVSHITWTNSIQFIRDAMIKFDYCVQVFNMRSRGNSPGSSCFYQWDGNQMCLSHPACHGCGVIKNINVIQEGQAYVNDKNRLPFTGMKFADNDDSIEFMEINLDKLRCR